MPCPDCKDGYYYPLCGPREACQTCGIETATQNLHKALASQVFLRQSETWRQNSWGHYVQTGELYEVTSLNDAELKRLLENKKRVVDTYTKGKNEILAEIYGGPSAKDYTIKDLIEKGLDTEEAIEVFNKLQRLKQRPHNQAEGRMRRGGIVPQDDVETSGQINIEPSLSRIPTKPIEYAKQIKQILQRNPSMTVYDLAEKISKPASYIYQYLDLLKLNTDTQILVDSGRITIEDALAGRVEEICKKISEIPKPGEISKSTDWAKYLPPRLKGRAALVQDVILRDEDDHQKDIVKTVVTQFFKLSTYDMCECVEERKTVTVSHLAAAVTEFAIKREKMADSTKNYGGVSKKALKENGFRPTL